MILSLAASAASAQTAPQPSQKNNTGEVVVTGKRYAAQANFVVKNANLGPLGVKPILDTPVSVTTIPEDLIINNQARSVNDTLRYLPSVEIRDQQGFEVSRPQSRGFMGSVVQDTRMDGLNIIGTSATASEGLAGVQVLNGMAGSLYGPQPAAGVFNYELKRPTDAPLLRVIGAFDTQGIYTEAADVGGRDGAFGYRLNVLHGQGTGYVDDSHMNRTLVQGDFDIHFDDRTVLELDASHYETNVTGLPGAFVYFGGKSTFLPPAVDPTRMGYGQPGAGPDLITDMGAAKIKHDFEGGWSLDAGVLYMDAQRNLFGITNTLTDNLGDYTVTKNFNAVPNFTIASDAVSLNGHVNVAGLVNDVSLGTNGFTNGQYSYRNSIAVTLGTGNLANPTVLPTKPTPANGGTYESGRLWIQSIVLGDTLHFNPQWSLSGSMSASFLGSKSYSAAGAVTSSDNENGVISPTVSLMYKPTQKLSLYATYANSVEQGDTAPTGTKNANQILSPYRDTDYEAGFKYALTPDFLITADGFRMTRPLAQTVAASNVFQVIGEQRNWGAELFGQGSIGPWLSLLGGVTYIDARLEGSMLPGTNDMRVVGVPHFKSDLAADLHPDVLRGFAFTGAVHYESDRAATNTNNSFAPSYATFDLGVRYSAALWGRSETLRAEVLNVGDVRYYSSIADGNIVGSAGANTAYLGDPRTVRLSLELGF